MTKRTNETMTDCLAEINRAALALAEAESAAASRAASEAAGAAEVAALMGLGAFSAPVKLRRSRKSRGNLVFAIDAVVTKIGPNPKRAGSKEFVKFSKIELGMTVAQMRKLGYNAWDLTFETTKGYIEIGLPN
jgi:hypothetical protein